MNHDDVIDVLSTIAAVDRRTVGEADVMLWTEILDTIPKDLALQAVIAHFREKPGVWLEPGHIYTRVKAMQRDQFDRQPLADIEAHTDRIDEKLAPFIVELADAKSIDTALKYQRPGNNPLRVACPHCRASAGRPCTTGARIPLRRDPRFHPSRIDAADAKGAADAGRTCMCGRDIFDDAAAACDRCAPTINGRNVPHRSTGIA